MSLKHNIYDMNIYIVSAHSFHLTIQISKTAYIKERRKTLWAMCLCVRRGVTRWFCWWRHTKHGCVRFEHTFPFETALRDEGAQPPYKTPPNGRMWSQSFNMRSSFCHHLHDPRTGMWWLCGTYVLVFIYSTLFYEVLMRGGIYGSRFMYTTLQGNIVEWSALV